MDTQVQTILAASGTKTSKIEQLILLGLTRTEIARLVTNGNYGFVQNVFAKMKADGRLNSASLLSFQPMPFERRFGVEIEAFGVGENTLLRELRAAGIQVSSENYNHDTRAHWKIVGDSSIRGEKAFELVSPVLVGESGLAQVQTVCAVLKTCNALVNRSCGLHIHFDAQNFDLKQWKNLYKNYGGFENEIDQLMPKSRRADENAYCKSLKVEGLNAKIDAATNLEKIASIFSNSRYFKINPTSYARHNTVEFRQHSGTIEFEKISNWVLFLHNLVEFSKNHLATDTTFDGLKKINQPAVMGFYHNRRHELAA